MPILQWLENASAHLYPNCCRFFAPLPIWRIWLLTEMDVMIKPVVVAWLGWWRAYLGKRYTSAAKQPLNVGRVYHSAFCAINPHSKEINKIRASFSCQVQRVKMFTHMHVHMQTHACTIYSYDACMSLLLSVSYKHPLKIGNRKTIKHPYVWNNLFLSIGYTSIEL